MEITFAAAFCSHGGFVRSTEDEVEWFERVKWENQHGKGTSYELNLIWFRLNLEFYRQYHLRKVLEEIGEELNNE